MNILYQKILFSLLLTIIIGLIGFNTGVFWDNITFISQVGYHLYANGILSWGNIPVEYDSCHPPFLASIIVIMWQLFGKSLLITHLFFWPLIFGVI